MKHLSKMLTWSAILCLSLLLGCEDQLESKKQDSKFLPDLSGLSKSDPNAKVDVRYRVYVFQSNHLYGVHSDTGEIQFLGNGWSNTQSATVIGTQIFAFSGGWFMVADCATGVVHQGGTSSFHDMFDLSNMTNDGVGTLFGISNGKLMRINANNTDSRYRLGTGDWTGATAMSFATEYNSGNPTYWLYIQKGGLTWRVDPSNGSYQSVGPSFGSPSLIPSSAPAKESNRFFGINDNILSWMNTSGGAVHPLTADDMSGVTDIAWTQYESCSTCTSGYYHNIFVIRNGSLYQYKGSNNPDNYFVRKIGISLPYMVISNQTR
jgi:hypothetical protein